MPSQSKPRLNLRIVLLTFALISAAATLANTFWVMFKTQEQELIGNALDANRAYALRIATGVEEVLSSDLDRLGYSATIVAERFTDQQQLELEVRRLLGQDESFNSVLIANADGTIVASAPELLHLNGQALQKREPLQRRQPMISNAFESLSGNLVVFVSYPVFDVQGQYLGLVGGTLRLAQENSLRALMDLNHRQNGAYVFLVDSQRRVLYHPDPRQIGRIIKQDKIVDAALSQALGSIRAVDGQGNEMLAGHAMISSSHWGIVSTQPMAGIQDSLCTSALKVAKGIIPLGLLGLLLIWWLGIRLSRPLSRLADSAKRLDLPESYERISMIPVDYAESWQLRRALLLSASLLQEKIGTLNRQAQTDALTGLANRRAMQDALAVWLETKNSIAVISLDIDHFKRVNDTYGHAVGDETLSAVAALMKQNARPSDLLCRTGGEEFVVLLPESSIAAATALAERLRLSIASADLETVGHITVSLGVALWRPGDSMAEVFDKADQLLYRAKQQGRNQVVAETRSRVIERVH
ncbi:MULTISPECIES: sensor domain-containing diguanylate cyclase [unclassified Pseudomonas]|uniref:sensor domain-containing diguanylate cyclase n=1 Tax=unclassified Pseudomonas TaxID=196821 RepID=UPI001AE69F10|nr:MULTISPECIES: sensor domain-containing diguanylate cyclase [unclassified Pseudomonas]MBP2273575.1 diguanylate cyclase (GGDEF)-like protein [Pseudomonas sp. BP6]MBP2287454.1 diguanylate cyclase (GGDEF)-like protein [Pseudomonas sp. BP7]HDS1696759.1 GGDEF domain-containing protein [Pseudomonas putida]HDS1701878.1 GGDEF domain-containing protein [Pseudomonas putida]